MPVMSESPVPRGVFHYHQDGRASHVRLETLIDCPFSLALEHAPRIFPVLEDEGGIRLPLRFTKLPIPGALRCSVLTHSFRQPDITESGRRHEEIAFDWVAKAKFLPNFRGVLRFRIEYEKTRVILIGEYAPPFGWVGRLFDRVVGRYIAEEGMVELVQRLAQALEERRGVFERGE
jgi:hypothetical protein